MSEAAKPHPALSLPGFTTSVKLSTGITAHIRKVDSNAVTVALARELTDDPERLATLSSMVERGEGKKKALTAAEYGLLMDVQRRTLKAALIQPTLAELLALYGGDEAADDYGLGADYTALANAVQAWNGGAKAGAGGG